MKYTAILGDVTRVVGKFALDNMRFDAVLSDAPYGLKFMGKEWDHGVPSKETWDGILETLHPGASMMVFGGSGTGHRLACAIEDAGADIRDVIMYLYGSGHPKGYDISKGTGDKRWEGYNTALKPAYEPIIWAMKPNDGGFAENAAAYGVAGINVDGTRVDANGESLDGGGNNPGKGLHEGYKRPFMRDPLLTEAWAKRKVDNVIHAQLSGRYPSNVIHDGSSEVLDLFPHSTSGATRPQHKQTTKNGNGITHGDMGRTTEKERDASSGSAARFFYSAKSSKRERHAGLDDFYWATDGKGIERVTREQYGTVDRDRRYIGNIHPTIKPISLCKYLATMLLPPERDTPRRILVPFSGSGSEMIGAMLAGWDEVIGIEISAMYTEIAQARLEWWEKVSNQAHTTDVDKILQFAYPEVDTTETQASFDDLPLFGKPA